ncbi:MAG: MFS transporter [Acidimicrobiia bacterium]|nr:MFS transporter [Acidimicrobiia bacterium]
MIYPLLPLFLLQTLGAGAVALGVIEGAAESVAALLKAASGRLADRWGRRKALVVAGYGISGAARPLIGLAGAWPAVAALRVFDRVGKGVRTSPRDALIADVTPPERHGAAFGLQRAMDHAGAVAGPLVAAALLTIPGMGLREVFLLAGLPALVVMAILVFAVHEVPRPTRAAPPTPVPGGAALSPQLRRFLMAVGIFTLGNSADAFLLLRFNDAGIGAADIALLWAGLHAVKMGATWFGGRLSDRLGRRPMVLAGWGVYAAVYLGFGLMPGTAGLVALFLVYGLYYGLTEPVERAWVADMAGADARGTAFGAYHAVIGLAALPASLLFGALYAGFGPTAAFASGAALAAIAALLLRRV